MRRQATTRVRLGASNGPRTCARASTACITTYRRRLSRTARRSEARKTSHNPASPTRVLESETTGADPKSQSARVPERTKTSTSTPSRRRARTSNAACCSVPPRAVCDSTNATRPVGVDLRPRDCLSVACGSVTCGTPIPDPSVWCRSLGCPNRSDRQPKRTRLHKHPWRVSPQLALLGWRSVGP